MSEQENEKDIYEDLKKTLEKLKELIDMDIPKDDIDPDLYKLLNLEELLTGEYRGDDEDEDGDEDEDADEQGHHHDHHHKHKHCKHYCKENTKLLIEIIILLINKKFGLKEIKKEIKIIETAVAEIETQVAVIDTNVAKIESAVFEVETQVSVIDTNIGKIITAVGIIETIIAFIPTIPIGEVSTQVAIIDTNVSEVATQVAVIDTNVAIIETIVGTIETLISEKSCGQCTSGRLTTGPVLLDNGVNSFVFKVLNENVVTLPEVDAFLFNIETCPRVSIFEATFINIPPKCSEHVIVGKPDIDLPDEFEVQFAGVTTDVFVSVAARTNAANAPIKASEIKEANSFYHSELSCTNDP